MSDAMIPSDGRYPAVAILRSDSGSVTLHQPCTSGEIDFIVLGRTQVADLVRALQALEDLGDPEDPEAPQGPRGVR